MPPGVDQVPPVDAISIARLHGEACIRCGSTQLPLLPAGQIAGTADGDSAGWPVVACPDHQGGE